MEWKELPVPEGAEIEIRGFLSDVGSGWILSNTPRIKSCCVSKELHLRLEGEYSGYSLDRPCNVRGCFHEDEGGYSLSAVSIEQRGGFPTGLVFGALLLMVLILRLKRLLPL
jgi:hypothetical protein